MKIFGIDLALLWQYALCLKLIGRINPVRKPIIGAVAD